MDYVMDVWQEVERMKAEMTPFEFHLELAWIRDCLQIFEREMDDMLATSSREEADTLKANYARLSAWVQTQ